MIIYPWISAVGTLSTTYTSTPDTASVDQDQGNAGGVGLGGVTHSVLQKHREVAMVISDLAPLFLASFY